MTRMLPREGRRPGPIAQKFNASIHREPYRTVTHLLFWFVVLVVVAPIAGIVLLVSGAIDSARRLLMMMLMLMLMLSESRGRLDDDDDNCDRGELAVLVTGCDSGLGRALVLRLADEGFTVFAGCLHPEAFVVVDGDGEEEEEEGAPESASSRRSGRIRPLRMDVTSQEDVDGARRAVEDWLAGDDDENDADGATIVTASSSSSSRKSRRRRRRFHALVNNAGIGGGGFFDWLDPRSDYEACLAVNCLGQIRTCKAFLPILKRQAKEDHHCHRASSDSDFDSASSSSWTTTPSMRIVNVNSQAGCLPSGHLALSPYEVSKNAAVSFTDGLRLELEMCCWGIDVVSVDPSFHASPMADPDAMVATVARTWKTRVPPETREEYGEDFLETYVDHVRRTVRSGLWEMSYATDSIVDRCILPSNKSPPAQIAFGTDARFLLPLLRMLPPAWRQAIFRHLLMPPLIPAALSSNTTKTTAPSTTDAEGKKPKRA